MINLGTKQCTLARDFQCVIKPPVNYLALQFNVKLTVLIVLILVLILEANFMPEFYHK